MRVKWKMSVILASILLAHTTVWADDDGSTYDDDVEYESSNYDNQWAKALVEFCSTIPTEQMIGSTYTKSRVSCLTTSYKIMNNTIDLPNDICNGINIGDKSIAGLVDLETGYKSWEDENFECREKIQEKFDSIAINNPVLHKNTFVIHTERKNNLVNTLCSKSDDKDYGFVVGSKGDLDDNGYNDYCKNEINKIFPYTFTEDRKIKNIEGENIGTVSPVVETELPISSDDALTGGRNDGDSGSSNKKVKEEGNSESFWVYLFGTIGALALFVGAFLMYRHISRIKDINKILTNERDQAKANAEDLQQKLKEAEKNHQTQLQKLERANSELQNKFVSGNSEVNSLNTSAHPREGVPGFQDDEYDFKPDHNDEEIYLSDIQTPQVVELNDSELETLAASIQKWVATNRGNTQLKDMLPNDLKSKLTDLYCSVDLWAQSEGIDNLQLAETTRNTSIVSFTNAAGEGVAYCLKQPNSFSKIWDKDQWYDVSINNNKLSQIQS